MVTDITLSIFLMLLTFRASFCSDYVVLPEVGVEPEEMIAYRGYPAEVHTVTTEDGYLLNVYRIPGALDSKPVLLVHGLFAAPTEFLFNGNESLAYVLSDAGYDVWMVSVRGTMYSRKHQTLDPDVDVAEYWNFSWHEMGYYDIPATIDYILDRTGQGIYYVGHSQGTSVYFAFASTRPEYNSKVRLAVSLAPIVYIDNLSSSAIRYFITVLDKLEELTHKYGIYEFIQHWDIFTIIGQLFCNDAAGTQDLCMALLQSFDSDTDKDHVNATLLPVYLSSFPAGFSLKQYFHYGQEVLSGNFQQYDYGAEKNIEIYGSETPLLYDLSQISTPVALFYSNGDGLTAPENMDKLGEHLPNLALKYLVPDDTFSHMGFAISMRAKELVYDKILELFQQYS